MFRYTSQVLKFCFSVGHLVTGVVWVGGAVAVDRLRGRPLGRGVSRQAQVLWSRGLCRIIGLRVSTEDRYPGTARPYLLVANHVSWLDIMCLASVRPLCFLSKAEVRRWPLIGPIAAGLGTLFIRRGARDAARLAVSDMVLRLRDGHSVLFFPEGTTTTGERVLPFRARLFQAAAEAGVQVRPVVLMYWENGVPSRTVPYVGDDTLVGNLWRLCGSTSLEMRQIFLDPLETNGQGRSALAAASHRKIVETLECLFEAPRSSATPESWARVSTSRGT